MTLRRARIPALLLPLLLAPLAASHTATYTETFASPTYVVTTTTGPTGTPCETFQERAATQVWATPPSGTGAPPGPWFPMHTTGTPPGAQGWHQAYMMKVTRTVRTDLMLVPGVCGLATPWVSSLSTEFQVWGAGTITNPADVIDITLEGTAATLAAYATASGATIAGSCFSAFVGGPPVPVSPATGTCTMPPRTVSGSGWHDLRLVAAATNPTSAVAASGYPTQTDVFWFRTVPTPGTGTPGGPEADRVNMVLPH